MGKQDESVPVHEARVLLSYLRRRSGGRYLKEREEETLVNTEVLWMVPKKQYSDGELRPQTYMRLLHW